MARNNFTHQIDKVRVAIREQRGHKLAGCRGRTGPAAAAWDALNLGLYVIRSRCMIGLPRRSPPAISTASPGPGCC